MSVSGRYSEVMVRTRTTPSLVITRAVVVAAVMLPAFFSTPTLARAAAPDSQECLHSSSKQCISLVATQGSAAYATFRWKSNSTEFDDAYYIRGIRDVAFIFDMKAQTGSRHSAREDAQIRMTLPADSKG